MNIVCLCYANTPINIPNVTCWCTITIWLNCPFNRTFSQFIPSSNILLQKLAVWKFNRNYMGAKCSTTKIRFALHKVLNSNNKIRFATWLDKFFLAAWAVCNVLNQSVLKKLKLDLLINTCDVTEEPSCLIKNLLAQAGPATMRNEICSSTLPIILHPCFAYLTSIGIVRPK